MGLLVEYTKKYKGRFFLSLLFVFLNVLSIMALPSLMASIVNEGIMTGHTEYILKTGILMLFIALFGGLMGACSSYSASYVSSKIARDLSQDLFRKAEDLTTEQMNQIGSSSLITRTTGDVDQLRQISLMSMRIIIRGPLLFTSGLILAFRQSVNLSLMLLAGLPIMMLVILLIGRKAMPIFKENRYKVDNMTRILREGVTGVRSVRAFNKKDYERDRFNQSNLELRNLNLMIVKLMSLMGPATSFLFNGITLFIVLMAARQMEANLLGVGELMAFIQYIANILFGVMVISFTFMMIPRASVSANRIKEVLELENPIEEEKNELVGTKGLSVEYEGVCFSFGDAEECTVCDVSFRMDKGETLAIIGGTGSGKSTLVNLLLRFLEVTQGKILVDGLNIKDWDLKKLRSKIGLVPQEAILFSGTIRSNLLKGNSEATEEDMERALKIAQAWDFVQAQGGLDARVSQRGVNFSGGQRQRLSIARAVVRDPDIFIFDDSFSALDFKTERDLLDSLETIGKNKINFVIAQRISTVQYADRILVLDEGKVCGLGLHDELMKDCSIYREIYESQIQEEVAVNE